MPKICKILKSPSPDELALRISEGEFWHTTLRLDQEYLGTVFITAKRHVASLPDVTVAEEQEFIAMRNRIIRAQMQEFGAKVVNVSCLMNHAFTAERGGSPHVHYHLKPRYAQPVERFGRTFVDRQFGAYIKEKYSNVVDSETAREIVAVLRATIESEQYE